MVILTNHPKSVDVCLVGEFFKNKNLKIEIPSN